MFLDVIFFIPTLFTYLLIGLLIVILCFVVVYISHKIYVSVYDNLPLAALPGVSHQQLMGLRHSNHAMTMREFLESSLRHPRSNQPSLRSLWIQNRSQILESSSVLRIVLSLEPCYLVSAEFDVSSSRRPVSFLCNCRDEPVCAAVEPRPSGSVHIVRYFDHLSKIPRLKVMLKCNQRRPEPRPDSRTQLTLNDVILEAREAQDAQGAQCTDNGAACRPVSTRRSSRLPD
ncbi:uncharacterized protein LOC128258081 [Drosophila gunungcola]|uniref:Uncharacterized protein n=1 Tax=Drosophila gunungcola TaxID=103775 RepID=A0A9Q0BQT9_9MUSC|nr:uncharacterized protein LOC128258081 [Drosophila gunungcola]KAI8040821.1 hypothetical protein M5D96_006764 [Drosophila gunungcola]